MNDDDINTTAALLGKLEPGFLPYPIFEQVARLVALPVVEFIPLRLSAEDEVEVLLITRPADDRYWPNMLHTPGTIVRATDVHKGKQDDWLAFERIMHDELYDTSVGSPHYVGTIFHSSKRGAEQSQLYWIEVLAEPKVGSFYNTASLPELIVASQSDFIQQATRDFRKYKNTNA